MLFFGGQRWICQAASGKPSTGRFSDPPFRIHFFMRNKKVIFLFRILLNFWWDGDLLRETFKGDDNRWGASSSSNGRSLSIVKWKGETLTQGIEGDILMIADLYGDWREEIITALPGEIRIYTTNLPAKDRRTTLMQDGIYRSYVAHRSMGYPQAPVPSYYLGE